MGSSLIAHNVYYVKLDQCREKGWHAACCMDLPTAWSDLVPRNRHRLNWIYDDRRQEFKTPAGRTISLAEIAQAVYEQQQCQIDFTGPWSGWRMRGDRLIPPGESRRALKPDTFKAFLRWISAAADQHTHQSNGLG
jgi:hypothetical protein